MIETAIIPLFFIAAAAALSFLIFSQAALYESRTATPLRSILFVLVIIIVPIGGAVFAGLFELFTFQTRFPWERAGMSLAVFSMCSSFAAAPQLAWLARSWRILFTTCAAGAASALIILGADRFLPRTSTMFLSSAAIGAIVWQLIIVLELNRWANRVKTDRPNFCPLCNDDLTHIAANYCPHCSIRRCAKCHYDLTGIEAGICPECGSHIQRIPVKSGASDT